MGNVSSKKNTGDLIRPIPGDQLKSDQIEKTSANPVPLEILIWLSKLITTDQAVVNLQKALGLSGVNGHQETIGTCTCASDTAYVLLSKWWKRKNPRYFAGTMSMINKLKTFAGLEPLAMTLLADFLWTKDAIERICSYMSGRDEYISLTNALHILSAARDGDPDWIATARETLEKWWEDNISLTLKSRMVKLINALNTSGLNYLSKHLNYAYETYCSFYDNYMSVTVADENTSIWTLDYHSLSYTNNIPKWHYLYRLVQKLEEMRSSGELMQTIPRTKLLKWIQWCLETGSHPIRSEGTSNNVYIAEDVLHTAVTDTSPFSYPKSLKEILSEKFLNSAIGEMHLYQTPLPPEGSKSCVILNPSPSVNLQIPDATETRYFSANIHLDRSLFAEVIPDNECLAAAIPEFHSFPEKTLAADQFYQIKLEHCLKSAEERKWLVVRQGCVQTGQKFEEIPHFPQATRDTAFYEVDEQYITIYSHHFTEFICTVCKKVCEQRARMFIFGSLKHVNDSTNVTVRPYICSSLYSTDIFRKKLFSMEKACRRVLLEEGDVALPPDVLHYDNHTVRFSLTPDNPGWGLTCAANFKTGPPGTFTRVRKIGDVFDYHSCHVCSQRDPNEMCTCYLRYKGSNIVPFEANAAVMISVPTHSRDEGIEVSGDEDTDTDNDSRDVTEFRVSIEVPPVQQMSTPVSAAYQELNEEEQLFLRRAAGCVSDDDKLWDIGITLGAVDKEITQIRTDNRNSIKQSAFKMLLFCYEKKRGTWEEFHSKLRTAFERTNMANEFEKLAI